MGKHDAENCYAGFIVTYVAPLAFVLCVTMGKEAYDDYQRHLRDREANSQKYSLLDIQAPSNSQRDPEADGLIDNIPRIRAVPSSQLKVGDLVILEKNQRVPADMVLLRTSDSSGTCFIRTDQLDGETDWKLRVAVPSCQKMSSDNDLISLDAEIYGAHLKTRRLDKKKAVYSYGVLDSSSSSSSFKRILLLRILTHLSGLSLFRPRSQ